MQGTNFIGHLVFLISEHHCTSHLRFIYLSYVYHMYIIRISYVHHMYIVCASYVYHMYIICISHPRYHISIIWISYVYHHMYIILRTSHPRILASGRDVSDDLGAIGEALAKLQATVNTVTQLVDQADDKYNSIDLLGLDDKIESMGGEYVYCPCLCR